MNSSAEQQISQANFLFMRLANATGKPVGLAWRNTEENSLKPGTTELLPDVCGLTIALSCNADEAQTIVDFILKFEDGRNGE